MATAAYLLKWKYYSQDKAKPDPSGISCLQEEVASPVLSLLLYAMVPTATFSQAHWLPGEPLGINQITRKGSVHILWVVVEPPHMTECTENMLFSIPQPGHL